MTVSEDDLTVSVEHLSVCLSVCLCVSVDDLTVCVCR